MLRRRRRTSRRARAATAGTGPGGCRAPRRPGGSAPAPPRASSPTWSRVQKMCASLSWMARTRVSPPSTPGQLGAVHPAQLGDPQRQLAVAVGAGAVDQRVVRAQAGPQHDLLAAEIHRREHVVAVVRPVPGDLVQLPLAQHRRVHVPVARPAARRSRMYSSRACRTAAPSGSQYGSPAPISGSVSNRPSSRPSLRWSCIGGLLADRRASDRRDEAPGHSPRGFGLQSAVSAPGHSPASS